MGATFDGTTGGPVSVRRDSRRLLAVTDQIPFVDAMLAGDLQLATEIARRTTPLHKMMNLTLAQHDPNSTVVTMELSKEVQGSAEGTVHGGMLATLADVTSAWALSGSYQSAEGIPVTTDMHIRYYRQPRSGSLAATATVVYSGRRIVSVECSIADGEQRVLARSTATYMIVPRDDG
jgi:uncharacterized protein (TIGR00369 family)